jgi:HPt (histidine-containing phosphotransfer) domain-containing protein
MAPRKDNSPSVATFADHEVITPPHPLGMAISHVPSADDEDPVARAEAALAQLSSEFAAWMHAECERLETARQNALREGLTGTIHTELFRAAHDIKGEAATFGYPAVADAAESLCRLLEHTPEISGIPLALVEQHVDAVRAITREHAQHRSRVGRRHTDPTLARGHGRIPARRKRGAAGLSGKHLRADAGALVRRPRPRRRANLPTDPAM